MLHGVLLQTRFSGIEAPAYAAHLLEKAFCDVECCQLRRGQGFTLSSAGDMDKHAQQCLQAFGDDQDDSWRKHAPGYIFGNIEDCVSEDALQAMQEIVDSSVMDASNASEEEKKMFMRQLMAPLMKNHCEALQVQDEAFITSRAGLRIHIAGTPCVDWSKRGKKSGTYGRTCIPHATWLSQVIATGVHIILHENTPDYPDFMLMDPLHFFDSREWKICVLRMGPSDLAVPVKTQTKIFHCLAVRQSGF